MGKPTGFKPAKPAATPVAPPPEAPALAGQELLSRIGGVLKGLPPAAVEPPPQPATAHPLHPQAHTPQAPARPGTALTAVPAAAAKGANGKDPVCPFVLRLSPTTMGALEARSAAERKTITVLIAEALQAAGYPVEEYDLRDRRKRRDYSALAAGLGAPGGEG